MANTVTILNYANTFGDWVVTTNALVKENNDLAANNYIKPTGTLYLNDANFGLQVANNAIVGGTNMDNKTSSPTETNQKVSVDGNISMSPPFGL